MKKYIILFFMFSLVLYVFMLIKRTQIQDEVESYSDYLERDYFERTGNKIKLT